MLENANETIDPAPEDVRDRKQVQSQREFEPLLDTEEAARLLRMHPRTLAAQETADEGRSSFHDRGTVASGDDATMTSPFKVPDIPEVKCPLCGEPAERCFVCRDCYCKFCSPIVEAVCCEECADEVRYGIYPSRDGGFEIRPDFSPAESGFATRQEARRFVQVLQKLDRE